MKKNISHILIAALILLQAASALKINSLQRRVENISAGMSQLETRVGTDIGAIYSNVDEMLKKEASLIESAAAEIGPLDAAALTVPVTFTLTPKEVSAGTAVSLDVNGELFPMEKNGTAFSAIVSLGVFDDAPVKIVIDENGVKKTTQDDRIGVRNMKETIFPTMDPRLIGEARYSSNTYKRKGTLSADIKQAASGVAFTEIRFVIRADDKVISDQAIPAETLVSGYEVDETISLNDGQVCTMTVIAADSAGLAHHYTVDHWVAGSGMQREPGFGGEQVYSADGKLLWERGYR